MRPALSAGLWVWLLTGAIADHVEAQGWDTTVTATLAPAAAPEIAPPSQFVKRPIPVRQARGHSAFDASQPAPASPPAAVVKPPIWTTAATGPPATAEPPPTSSLTEPAAPRSNFVRQFCVNVAEATADARYAWQKKTLVDLEQELDKRLARLEAKAAETRDWLTRRDEFSKKARDGLVLIYARMRPDAAAAQLSAMDEETAAAVLNRLDPRNASVIMSEMDPARAARLTAIIAGAARIAPPEPTLADLKEKRS
jgi:flagellar motility protein MotE (MotC chaperone)